MCRIIKITVDTKVDVLWVITRVWKFRFLHAVIWRMQFYEITNVDELFAGQTFYCYWRIFKRTYNYLTRMPRTFKTPIL